MGRGSCTPRRHVPARQGADRRVRAWPTAYPRGVAWGVNDRAGTPAQESDLVDIDALRAAYYDLKPDVSIPEQRVVFGTSGHRGSSLNTAFNENHIAATTQ